MRKKIIAFFTGAMIVGALASGQALAAEVYTVQPGDSLWKISQKHGTSIQQLKSWNNLSSDLIFPNQQLHISADATVNKEKNIDDVYTVKSGDSLWKISQKFGIQVRELKVWNKLSGDLIQPGQKLAVKGDAVPVQTKAANTAPQQSAPVQKEVAAPEQVQEPAPKQAQKSTSKQAQEPVDNETSAHSEGSEMTVTATAYTASCNGCSGVTATGIDLRKNPGQKVIAVDPSVIPLGSKVEVEGYGTAIAGDTGGAIKGHKIDVFIPSQSEAMDFGVKQVKIKVLN